MLWQARKGFIAGRSALDSGSAVIDPIALLDSADGFYYDFTDKSNLFTDSGGTTPVTASGDKIGFATDLGANGNNATQGTVGAKPTYTEAGGLNYAAFDTTIVSDVLVQSSTPATDYTLALCWNSSNTAGVAVGAAGASDGFCWLSLNPSNFVSGGFGTDSYSTIVGASVDAQSTDMVLLLRGNATTVQLWLNDTKVYDAGSNGVTGFTVPFHIGALNFNGSDSNPFSGSGAGAGRIYRLYGVQTYVDDSYLTPIYNMLRAGVL